jgi:transcription initiation factor TFIID subunit TAF12
MTDFLHSLDPSEKLEPSSEEALKSLTTDFIFQVTAFASNNAK